MYLLLFILYWLSIITPFNKGITSCRWLKVKELKVKQWLERFNGKRSKGFISDSSCIKRTYVTGNNSSSLNLIAINRCLITALLEVKSVSL